MTGTEHYAEAERILTAASEHMAEASAAAITGDGDTFEGVLMAVPSMLAAAQVHATLATAAATRDFLVACEGDYPPRIAVAR